MKIGLKVGPANWQDVLARATPECAEVWFRLDWAERIEPIYAALQAKNIPFGIHFWAITSEGFEPNLAIETEGLAAETVELVKQTIDIASHVGATYVNVHPGGLRRKYLDLDHSRLVVLDGQPLSLEQAESTLLPLAQHLNQYASQKKIQLLFETLPRHEGVGWSDPSGHLEVQVADNLPPSTLLRLGENGLSLTNDFGHTLASFPELQGEDLQQKLVETTEKLAPFTKLIHLNTLVAPFNGTDSHNGILPEDFAQQVIPSESVCREMLSQFRAREDVWVVLEAPIDKMAENYQVLSQWKANNFSS